MLLAISTGISANEPRLYKVYLSLRSIWGNAPTCRARACSCMFCCKHHFDLCRPCLGCIFLPTSPAHRRAGGYEQLVVALLVPVSKLQEIMALSPQSGIARWRIDLLQFWLDSTSTASWSDIITALEKIGHHTLTLT